MFLLLLIKPLVDERCHHSELGEPFCKFSNTRWTGNKIEEQNAVLRNSSFLQHLYGEGRRATYTRSAQWSDIWEKISLTGCKHGIQEKDPSLSNIGRQLIVEQLGHACLLITLNENLSDAN